MRDLGSLPCIGFGKGHGASCELDKVGSSLQQCHRDLKQSVMSEIGA